MKAMILAAGRGERMGDLTNHLPKSLLKVNGAALIEHVIFNLKTAGINEIIINISYLKNEIKKFLGDGKRYNVKITYSEEAERLETGGGIYQVLSHFGKEPFLVVSSDIISNYRLEKLMQQSVSAAHLVLVDNPSYHSGGDFKLVNGYVCESHNDDIADRLTYANIAILNPTIFVDFKPGYFKLKDVLLPAIEKGLVTGEHFKGTWFNIGTQQEFENAKRYFITRTPNGDRYSE